MALVEEVTAAYCLPTSAVCSGGYITTNLRHREMGGLGSVHSEWLMAVLEINSCHSLPSEASFGSEVYRTMPSIRPMATFEQLVLPLLPSLYNHACWLARNPIEAEDLAQEAITKALRGFASFEPGTNFKAWIFRILRNTFLTSKTGLEAARTLFLEDQLEPGEELAGGHTPEENLIRLSDRAALETALEQLQEPLREVLLLCDVEELKYKEIAVVLDLPIGTVMSRISRARSALRQLLQPQFGASQ